jgi:hypothetical protein
VEKPSSLVGLKGSVSLLKSRERKRPAIRITATRIAANSIGALNNELLSTFEV